MLFFDTSTIIAICCAVTLAITHAQPYSDSQGLLTVSTTSGKIHGLINQTYPNVRQFLGVPFAQPPVGSLRWEPPQALPPSAADQEVFATQLPVSCPQILNPISASIYVRDVLQFNLQGLNVTGATSEDCLTLSVWAPTNGSHGRENQTRNAQRSNKTEEHDLLPVIVFIYGGGFSTGGVDVPYQIPTQWVERTKNHIVISFNYRVNLFGFPNAAGLTEQNLGLLDQRAAVEWVYANIGQFGGDASRITLWGQSAGSQSVDYFNFAYYDDPIVAGLIMDSGSASSGSPFDTQHTNFSFVASQVGCEGYSEQPAEQLSCMRSIDVKTLENFLYGYTVNGSTPSLTFRPVIDEKLVFSNYTARALDGYVANIPAIMGTNAQDGVPFAPYNSAGVNLTIALYELLANFFCPETQTILGRQANHLPTFRYLYAGNFSNIAPRAWEGAYHSSELPMLMGTYDNYRGTGSTLEMKTSVAMQDAYLAFARAGTSGIERTGWMAYSELGENVVREFGNAMPVQNTGIASLEALCSQGKPTFSL